MVESRKFNQLNKRNTNWRANILWIKFLSFPTPIPGSNLSGHTTWKRSSFMISGISTGASHLSLHSFFYTCSQELSSFKTPKAAGDQPSERQHPTPPQPIPQKRALNEKKTPCLWEVVTEKRARPRNRKEQPGPLFFMPKECVLGTRVQISRSRRCLWTGTWHWLVPSYPCKCFLQSL